MKYVFSQWEIGDMICQYIQDNVVIQDGSKYTADLHFHIDGDKSSLDCLQLEVTLTKE